MHLKNFSLIRNNEQWFLSPAYDLLNVNLHLPEDTEETALTINGKKRKLKKTDFVDLGLPLQLTKKQFKTLSTDSSRMKKNS